MRTMQVGDSCAGRPQWDHSALPTFQSRHGLVTVAAPTAAVRLQLLQPFCLPFPHLSSNLVLNLDIRSDSTNLLDDGFLDFTSWKMG